MLCARVGRVPGNSDHVGLTGISPETLSADGRRGGYPCLPPTRPSSDARTEETMSVNQELKRFLRDESGAEFVEWAVVTVILLAVSVPVLILIGDELARILTDILAQLERMPEG